MWIAVFIWANLIEFHENEDVLPEMTENWAFTVRASIRRLIGHLILWYTSGFE